MRQDHHAPPDSRVRSDSRDLIADLIAGFDARDAGTIHIENRLVAGPGVNEAPEKRRVGMEFQEGALVSHLSVAHNVAFGLEKGRQRVNFREREC